MATQTTTQRQASGHKATATRRTNAAKRSASSTRNSARATRASARVTVRTSAQSTSENAKRTGREAGRTAARGLSAAGQRVEELGRRAERVLLIQVGAAANVGDNAQKLRDTVVKTLRTYGSRKDAGRELNRLEQRGAKVLGRTAQSGRRRRSR